MNMVSDLSTVEGMRKANGGSARLMAIEPGHAPAQHLVYAALDDCELEEDRRGKKRLGRSCALRRLKKPAIRLLDRTRRIAPTPSNSELVTRKAPPPSRNRP
jgi:hypothetical protein